MKLSAFNLSVPVRLTFAVSLALLGIAIAAVAMSLPKDGRITGVCLDRQTHLPVRGVTIFLSQDEQKSANNQSSTRNDHSPDAYPDNSAPNGWAQSSQADSDLGLGGASEDDRDEWAAHSNDRGLFHFAHVPPGVYKLTTDSRDHNEVDQSVVISEGSNPQINLDMTLSAASLTFDNPTVNWYPGEVPVLGLNGVTTAQAISVSLDKMDVDAALKVSPGALANSFQNSSAAEGLPESAFKHIASWSVPVNREAGTASFFQRISLIPPKQVLPSAGLYRLTASVIQPDSDGKLQTTDATGWARVTRLAMMTKTYGQTAIASVVDLQTGASVPGLPVTLYEMDTPPLALDSTIASPQGLARLSTAKASKESEGAIIARDTDGSVTGVIVNMNSPGGRADEEDSDHPASDADPNAPSLRDFIYTDRPVYRPGQTVNLKGIMRLFAQSTAFTVPANRAVTVHITDAQSTVVADKTLATNSLGSWNTSVVLSTEALTGEYSVHVAMGDFSDDATFDVAAYKKPEFQIKVSFDKPRYIRGDTIHAKISASYFFGSPVTQVKAHVDVYRGDSLDDSDSGTDSHDRDNGNVSGESLTDEDVVLDGDGEATITIPTKDQPEGSSFGGSGDTGYSVEASISDISGQSADTTGQTTVAQGLFDLSVTPATGFCSPRIPVEVTIGARDASDMPLATQPVDVEAVYDEWDGNAEKFTPVSKSSVTTGVGGTAVITITPPRAGYLLIRARSTDIRGNKIESSDGIWVASDGGADLSARYADLSLVLDKKSYQVSDTASLLINTAHPGAAALVTIEGTTLYRAIVVPLNHRSTSIQIPVELAYAPGVRISADCIAGKQFLSAKVQLATSDPQRPLQVSITADRAKYGPGDLCRLQIKTKDLKGRPVPAEVSVGVVDSAVYAIEPEDPRKIVDSMEPDQDDGVTTNDSCETIYYGDADKGATNIDIRRKFPDTALWAPDILTGADGAATVQFTMPDSLTTWHAVCIGHTAATQIGKGAADMTVSKDLLARLEAPSFLVSGDRSTLSAVLHNNSASPMAATARLIPSGLSFTGGANTQVTLQPGVPARQDWPISALENLAEPAVTVRSGSLSDGVAEQIPILPHGTVVSSPQSGMLSLHNLQPQNYTYRVKFASSAILGSSNLRIRIAPTIASSIMPALDYLTNYPYGTSYEISDTLAADAIVSRAARVNGSPVAVPMTASMRAKLNDMTSRAVLRLYRVQSNAGGWGWFAHDDPSLDITAKAMWALSLAKDAGYPLNQDILDNGKKQFSEEMNEERTRKYPDTDSLSLGALALAKFGEKEAAINNLRFVRRRIDARYNDESNSTRAIYVLAEHEIGGAEDRNAQAEMAKLWALARVTGDECSWTSEYHSSQAGVMESYPDTVSTAWVFTAAQAVSPDDPRLGGIALWLMRNRNDDHWNGCTCATTASVMALTGYLAKSRELQPDFNVTVRVGGKMLMQKRYTPADVMSPDQTIDIPAKEFPPGGADVAISAQGTGRCYFSMDVRTCMPVAAVQQRTWLEWLASKISAHLKKTHSAQVDAQPFKVRRVYLRTTSRRNFLMEDTVPKPDQSFNAGEDIVVRLIIDSAQPGSRMIVDEPVPAGCRITELSSDAYDEWSNWWDYTDVRDDRVVFYIRDLPRGRHEIDYHLQASIAGQYDIMPTQISSEADPAVHASGEADHVGID